ncbi:MAG: ABC transporter ATP-binding protein [Oscillospiraceae bacterium]|nr:ABC transporter ATP-binding protein [Oscillospiraceae bacterium]
MIRFENVTFGYRGKKPVIENLDLEIRPGDRLCLFGPSGLGKTTVLRLLMGLEKPRRGQITGTEGLRFSAVFQEDRLIGRKTVLENAALFAEESAARAVLERLGLGDVLDSLPGELSGGQRRRAALGRALAHPFDVLVLDEALTGLDEAASENCLAVIDEMAKGRTVVMVSHDRAHAQALGAELLEL